MSDPDIRHPQAIAYWTTAVGTGEFRSELLPPPRDDEVVVRALYSGISRGTELLVRRGAVPASQHERMRAPFQAGDFAFPVKYGYLSVGVVERGPDRWVGERVFCLFPHQDRYIVPIHAVTRIPDAVPDRRAILAGTVETAVNALWDVPPCLGDRVTVIGGGLIGGAVALVLSAFPVELEVVESNPDRRSALASVGLRAVAPEDAALDRDVVYHASATESGLRSALALAGTDSDVVELSWFGTSEPRVPLGEDFHSRRIRLRASQVSRIGVKRRHRRTTSDRLQIALSLLADARFDILIDRDIPFGDLDHTMSALDADRSPGCVAVHYPETRSR